MNSKTTGLLLAAALLLGPDRASADLINTSFGAVRKVTPAEAAGGAPLNGDVYQFVVTTDADILSIDHVRVYDFATGLPLTTLYQHPVGHPAHLEPPDLTLLPFFPALSADTWVNTPGMTLLLGPGLPGDGDLTLFGDLSNDGPQNNFVFAQLTVPEGTQLGFSGRISTPSVINPGGLFEAAFSFVIPEPQSMMLGSLGAVGMAIARRRRRNCRATPA